jgi:hypothetical protein
VIENNNLVRQLLKISKNKLAYISRERGDKEKKKKKRDVGDKLKLQLRHY